MTALATRLDPWRVGSTAVVGGLAVAVGYAAGVDPLLAIGAALAVAFMLLALSDLTRGLVAFTLLTFLQLVPGFAGPALSLAKVAGGVLVISWLASASEGRRREFPVAHPYLTAVLALFVAWNALSVVWAPVHGPVVIEVSSFVLNFALFPIVYAAVTSKRDARLLIGAFIAGSVVAAGYGLITQPSVAALASSPAAANGLDRVSGTLGDPNELASVLAAGIALCTALIFDRGRSPLVRMVTALAGVLLLASLLFTLSRGGIIALAAVAVVTVLVRGRNRLQAAFLAATVAAAVFLWFFNVASPAARDHITAVDGGSGRTEIWSVGWRMVEAHPLDGVGAGNFQNVSIHYFLQPGSIAFANHFISTPAVAHNTYLQVLSETGVVGLALFLVAIFGGLATGVAALRIFRRARDREGELLTGAVITATVAILVAYFFLSEEHSKYLWLLVSLCPALLAIARRDTGRGSVARLP